MENVEAWESKDGRVRLFCGDCLDALAMVDGVDSVLTDPPYGLGFMGKAWDHGVPGVPFWDAILAAAKPGAMLLAFGGTRTFHRLSCAIEDAGWELRDVMSWIYGSGFPKSLDVSKAIDKAAGAERETGDFKQSADGRKRGSEGSQGKRAEGLRLHGGGIDGHEKNRESFPATPAAATWAGWGTALKPAWEPIVVAMKPLDGTFAENALAHGVAGFNIDGGRIGTEDRLSFGSRNIGDGVKYKPCRPSTDGIQNDKGRFPANVLHDGSEEVLKGFPDGESKSGGTTFRTGAGMEFGLGTFPRTGHDDRGSAARFFYTAKAAPSERWIFCRDCKRACPAEDRDLHKHGHLKADGSQDWDHIAAHPTVKPQALMVYLARLIATPTGGTVLDPFMGSGSTGVAVVRSGRNFIGIEKDRESFETAKARIIAAMEQGVLNL